MAWDVRKRCAARNWQCSIAKSGNTRSTGPASSRRANGRIWTVSRKPANLKKGASRDEFAVVSSHASLRRPCRKVSGFFSYPYKSFAEVLSQRHSKATQRRNVCLQVQASFCRLPRESEAAAQKRRSGQL